MLLIKDLKKIYKGTDKGVNGITLHIEKGDIYAFIGHNGAGKTTALRCISGIHGFDEGEVLIDGINIKNDPYNAKRRIGYIPDNPDIYEYLTGIQYLSFIADIFCISKEKREEKIKKYADIFGMTEALGGLISSYSHGMKQKLALISAFIHEPSLLILDEPFVGLDPKASHSLKTLMKELCQKGGAVFFSTHVLEVAEKLCNKIAIIKNGGIVISGKTEDVLNEGMSLEELFMGVVGDE